MLIPHGTLILIADSSGYRLLRNRGSDRSPSLESVESSEREETERPELHEPSALPDAAHRVDGSKRAHDRVVAGAAYDVLARHGDAPAIVFAPPRMLGAIRGQYSDAFRSRLLSDFDKDFIHHTPHEIAQFLQHFRV